MSSARGNHSISQGSACSRAKSSSQDFRAFVESKLPLIPRYRQRVVFPPFDLGLPSWEFDPKFDIRNHVRKVTLKHGTEQELKSLAAKIVSTRLNRERPLWDFTLARLQGGRTGMVTRIHHCLADGIAGVGAMNVIMDTTPAPPPLARKQPETEPQPQPKDPSAVLLSGLAKSYLSLVSGALTLQTGLLNIAQEAVANPANPPAEILRLVSELAAPAERLPFNTVCRGPQKFAWTEVPLADIKAVKNTWGGTVNDVILTTVTLAFGRYAEQRGVDLKGRSLRIVIPVNVRGNGERHGAGKSRSPSCQCRSRWTYAIHRSCWPWYGSEWSSSSAPAPPNLWACWVACCHLSPALSGPHVGPVASQLPLSLCNIICTNVPGPQMPLYLMGHKMLSWYPWVPIGGLMGINCAILTYNGTAYFGFTGDVHAAPDLERLEKFVDQSFAEVRAGASAGVEAKPQRQRRERPNPAVPPAKARTIRKKSPPPVSLSKRNQPAPSPERADEPEKALAVGA